MKWTFRIKTISLVFLYGISLLLLYTGVEKLLAFDSFLIKIAKSELFPNYTVSAVAVSVILLEIVSSILLFFLPFKRLTLIFSLIIFVFFLLYNIMLYWIGANYDCACSKIFESLSFSQHLVFLSFLIIGLLFVWVKVRPKITN